MTDKKKMEDNQPGMDQKRDVDNDNYSLNKDAARTGEQGRAAFHAGSATQGGSNHGQGSHYLGGDHYHQGGTANAGANYESESGRLGNEQPLAGTSSGNAPGLEERTGTEKGKLSEDRDDIPHGQGAHVNEQEANAREEYPGPEEVDSEKDEPEKDII
jgi:hypothetical protein